MSIYDNGFDSDMILQHDRYITVQPKGLAKKAITGQFCMETSISKVKWLVMHITLW